MRSAPRSAIRAAPGFTLVEILVAVAILAVALAAAARASALATDSARDTRGRLLATWAAENRIAELRARGLFPPPATSTLSATQGAVPLTIAETVADTANPAVRRVDLAVADARDPARTLATLTAFISRP